MCGGLCCFGALTAWQSQSRRSRYLQGRAPELEGKERSRPSFWVGMKRKFDFDDGCMNDLQFCYLFLVFFSLLLFT